MWHLAYDALIRLKAPHQFLELVLLNALLLCVVLLEQRLDLILLPLYQGNLRVLPELLLVF